MSVPRCAISREDRRPGQLRLGAGRRPGQALIIGVTVMFILLALGLVFLRTAMDHLQTTGRIDDRMVALQAANSGNGWTDHELMTSPLGADWRPAPRNLNPAGLPGYAVDPPLAALDPDFDYLRPWAPQDTAPVPVTVYKGQTITRSLAGPTGGYMRVDFGQGRALIRVTYNPRNALTFNGQPINLPLSTDLPAGAALATRGPWQEYGPTQLSQYLRIDAIGRVGNTTAIDNAASPYTDPTLLEAAGIDTPYRVSMVAYKAFGLGEHLLFVTNKESEGTAFDVGFDPRPLSAPNTSNSLLVETPYLQAGDLGFTAPNTQVGALAGDIYVNGAATFANTWVYADTTVLRPHTGVNVAGAILGSLYMNATGPWNTPLYLTGSMANDLVRDFQWFTNPAASTYRSVKREAAPVPDLDRFRTLTQGPASGGLYIPNYGDMQPQIPLASFFPNATHSSQDLDTLASSWSNPYNPPGMDAGSWQGGNPGFSYVPPAVEMEFCHPKLLTAGAGLTDPDPLHYKYYYIRLYWPDGAWPWPSDGTDSGSQYLDVYYTPDAAVDPGVLNAAATHRMLTDPTNGGQFSAPVAILRDHTIMAEGNLSVHGDIAPGMTSNWWNMTDAGGNFVARDGAQLVVVSRGTIYLDGSLNRAIEIGPGSGDPLDIQSYGLSGLMAPSMVALLAEDHLAVNLTRSGARVQSWDPTTSPDIQKDDDIPADSPDVLQAPGTEPVSTNHWTFDPNSSGSHPRLFRITFSLAGVTPGAPIRLYLRHAAASVNSQTTPNTEVAGYLNPPPVSPGAYPFYNDNTPYTYTVGSVTLNNRSWRNSLITKAVPPPDPVYGPVLAPWQTSLTPLTQASGIPTGWEYSSYDLDPNALNYFGENTIGVEVMSDQYFLSRVAVLPVINGAAGMLPAFNLEGVFMANGGGFYVVPKDYFYMPVAGPGSQRLADGGIPTGNPVDFSDLYGGAGPAGDTYWVPDSSYPDSPPRDPMNPNGPPLPGVPLLTPISLLGSLTVDRQASQSEQARWVQYDPAGQTETVPGVGPATTYAPLLSYCDSAVDISYRDGNWLPVMPRMPMSPGLDIVYENFDYKK